MNYYLWLGTALGTGLALFSRYETLIYFSWIEIFLKNKLDQFFKLGTNKGTEIDSLPLKKVKISELSSFRDDLILVTVLSQSTFRKNTFLFHATRWY
jgi:hypothetical protein